MGDAPIAKFSSSLEVDGVLRCLAINPARCKYFFLLSDPLWATLGDAVLAAYKMTSAHASTTILALAVFVLLVHSAVLVHHVD